MYCLFVFKQKLFLHFFHVLLDYNLFEINIMFLEILITTKAASHAVDHIYFQIYNVQDQNNFWLATVRLTPMTCTFSCTHETTIYHFQQEELLFHLWVCHLVMNGRCEGMVPGKQPHPLQETLQVYMEFHLRVEESSTPQPIGNYMLTSHLYASTSCPFRP